MGIPRPKAMDLADDDDSYKWIRIAQADSDDGAII